MLKIHRNKTIFKYLQMKYESQDKSGLNKIRKNKRDSKWFPWGYYFKCRQHLGAYDGNARNMTELTKLIFGSIYIPWR